MTTVVGFIVRETEKAVAVVSLPLSLNMSPLWVPLSKIESLDENDGYSPSVQLKGENVRRMGVPVTMTVNQEWADKVGIIDA